MSLKNKNNSPKMRFLSRKRIKAGLLKKTREFRQKRSGSVAIEFALVMPIYVLILSSGFELTMYALLQNKLQRLAGIMADTVSRQGISRESLSAYLEESGKFITPFGFTPGKITISHLQNTEKSTDADDMRISWQESFQGQGSKMGLPGEQPQSLPESFILKGDQTAIVAEIKYSFSSFVFSSLIGNREIYVFFATVPRQGSMDTLLGENSLF